jgi:mono/diheme cytochrome c family protein
MKRYPGICTLGAVLLLAAGTCGCSKKQAETRSGAGPADSSRADTSGIHGAAPSPGSDNKPSGASAVNADSLLSYEQRQGRVLYTKYCLVCHGAEGKGDGFNAFNLDPKPRDLSDARVMGSLSDERIVQTIAGGGRSVNKSPLMPSWGGRLHTDEITYLLAYIRTFQARPSPE